jgi:hypothetical protein
LGQYLIYKNEKKGAREVLVVGRCIIFCDVG